VQAKNVNSNATDEMFTACTIVKHIMTDLSNAATEEEKVAIIIKMCLDCRSAMPTTVHRHLKIIAFSSNSIGRQARMIRKQLKTCGIVDAWRENDVLNFYINVYCCYNKYMD
jgi:hypothetical protein